MMMSLENLRKLLLAVVDDMFEGVQIISKDGRYLYLNKAAARQGKRERDSLIGKLMVKEYPGIEKSEFYALMQESIRTGEQKQMVNHFEYPDGSSGWFKLLVEPFDEGVLILSVDISDMKAREEELERRWGQLSDTLKTKLKDDIKMGEIKTELEKIWK